MKTLPVEDTSINYFFSTLKNKKRKHLNIAVSKLTELPIEFEGCNISRISQIRKILYPQNNIDLLARET